MGKGLFVILLMGLCMSTLLSRLTVGKGGGGGVVLGFGFGGCTGCNVSVVM